MKGRMLNGTRGSEAVRRLRQKKLQMGLPFMINAKELSPGQAYLEFPDGTITLVLFPKLSTNFNILRKLSLQEADKLRKIYRL